ncbi:MAG: hypothetical protein COW88_02600 [Candidatus Lloydbacteria bacterium CG22_combo_CG10-13_8_21_14_all_47_15]|uniref:Lipid II flippase MurJ n=1 Tax=Candidatus Lloydbacteria bacterium CG22_combo_CG10-13_8_21_14_all_47_15 TaxID=1974635 RepID=A0A2H0CTN5_9BACT|nr:MAG: hypothetical protein COW88_02600 [Candidatus Lloydbacteria bacterium CG22_combo_CG10-13_8_21_14_all_47_15]
MQRLLTVFNRKWSGLHEAAYLLGIFAFLSQILALVRDRILAGTFGAGAELDIYYAAFRIPDFLYVAVASFVSASVLIPFFIEKLGGAADDEAGRTRARRFLNTLFTGFALVMVSLAGIAWLFMPWLSLFVAPGFSDSAQEILVTLSRFLLLSPILLGISNLFGTVTQSFRQFFVFALSPVLYNAGIILGAVFLVPSFGITGVVYGVVLGAFLHLLIQMPAILHNRFLPKITGSPDWHEFLRVVRTSFPRTLALSMTHLVLIVLIAIASRIDEGSIAIFTLAFNLQSVPLSIIGVSYSVAAFPTLARLFVNGERAQFVEQVVVAAKHIIFWSLPVLALFIVLRAQIVRTILGTGRFDWADTRMVAAALALFAVSVVAQSLVLLFVRGYYAAGNTKTPLLVNVVSSLLIIAAAAGLLFLHKSTTPFLFFIEDMLRVSGLSGTSLLMLPLAFSVGALFNAILLWVFFKRDFGLSIPRLRESFFHSFAGAIFMGFTAHRMLTIFDDIFDLNTFWGIFLQGFASGAIGILAGVFLLWLLKNKEILEIWEAFHHRFWKAEVVAPDQREL